MNIIKEKFDLIILSHSLEHLIDPVKDLKLLSSKLSETGKIIVQIPDYQNNPYDLIVYDTQLILILTRLIFYLINAILK